MKGFCVLKKRLPILVVLIGSSVIGCAHRRPALSSPNVAYHHESPKLEKSVTIPIPEKLPCARRYQEEISHLKQMLAEKDELIQRLSLREVGQEKMLQETASEFSRTKSQLHRLATQPQAASKIAEVEVAMDALKQSALDESGFLLQSFAQRLLDVATTLYRQMDYSKAMSYAAQSRELINMAANLARRAPELQHVTVIFRTPISLWIVHDTDLMADSRRVFKILCQFANHLTRFAC